MTGVISDMPRLRRAAQLISWAGLAIVILGLAPAYGQSRVRLEPVTTVRLNKPVERIDQVVGLPGGGLVIRSSDFRNEATQAIEIFDGQGHYRTKVGTFGRSPGQYYRLKSIAVAGNGHIYVADVIGRITQFSQDGQVLNTKLIQNPQYHVYGLALDEPRGSIYLSGCLPKQFYLDLGCRLVHRYSLNGMAYQRSFLDTDAEAVQKHLLSLEDYHIDTDAAGRIWAVDAPVLKLFRIDPATSRTQSFPLRSSVATPVAAIAPNERTEVHQSIADASFLIDRVLTTGPYVVVSLRRPQTSGYLLQIFNASGQQVATDVNSPGRLVGKTKTGRLYFAANGSRGTEVTEYALSAGRARR